MQTVPRTPNYWYMAILAVLGLGFVVSAALAFWANQKWQWRLTEKGRFPELIPWKRPFVSVRPELRRPSITFCRTAYRVSKRFIALLFRPDPDPELEILRQRTARLLILTLAMWVAALVALLTGGLILAPEG